MSDNARSVKWPPAFSVVESGIDPATGKEYAITQCTSFGEPTEDGYRRVEAFYDRRMRKSRLRVTYYRDIPR